MTRSQEQWVWFVIALCVVLTGLVMILGGDPPKDDGD